MIFFRKKNIDKLEYFGVLYNLFYFGICVLVLYVYRDFNNIIDELRVVE